MSRIKNYINKANLKLQKFLNKIILLIKIDKMMKYLLEKI
jgi:hypothetical protein